MNTLLAEVKRLRADNERLLAENAWLRDLLAPVDALPEAWNLTRTQKRLANVLLARNGAVTPHETIWAALWGDDEPSLPANNVRMQILSSAA